MSIVIYNNIAIPKCHYSVAVNILQKKQYAASNRCKSILKQVEKKIPAHKPDESAIPESEQWIENESHSIPFDNRLWIESMASRNIPH